MLQSQPPVAAAFMRAAPGASQDNVSRIITCKRRRRRQVAPLPVWASSSSSPWSFGFRTRLAAFLAISVLGHQSVEAFRCVPRCQKVSRGWVATGSMRSISCNGDRPLRGKDGSRPLLELVGNPVPPPSRLCPPSCNRPSTFLLSAIPNTTPSPSNTNPVADSRERLYSLVNVLHAQRDAADKAGVMETVQLILKDSTLDLTPKHCTMLVSALGAVGLPRETVVAMHAMKERGLSLNKVTYGAVINACAYGKDMAAARLVMDEMRSDGVMPDAVEYSNLLHGYKRLNATEECLACFDEMLFYGIKATTRTYDGVLGALAAAERWPVFRMYLDRMRKEGVRLSAITYGWAVRGAERGEDWGEVLKLFRAMQTDRYQPTASACHAALKASLALNDVETAVAATTTLLREGWTMGRRLYASVQFRLLMGGKRNLLEALVREAEKEMPSVSAAAVEYGAITLSRDQGTKGKAAVRLVPFPPSTGPPIPSFPYHDTNSCNLLLTELAKHRRLDLACIFLSLMNELGLGPADAVSYNILMDLALKVKRPGKLRELFAEMQQRGIRPEVITYNILLSACATVAEDRTQALGLWADFKASGLLADRILYLSLMRALRPDTADRRTVLTLLDEASSAGIPLDTQLANYALRLLAGARDVEGVEMLLDRMRTNGVGRDVVSWTTAIKAFHEARDWAKALSWLGEMEADGVKPNEMTYATAMHVLSQAGQWREALRLLGRMEAKGIRNVVALTSAMTACETGKAYEEGLALWGKMQDVGLRPTMATVDVALKLCEKVLVGLASTPSPPSPSPSTPVLKGYPFAPADAPSESSRTWQGTKSPRPGEDILPIAGLTSPSPSPSPPTQESPRHVTVSRAITILEQSIEWGLVGRRAIFRRVLRMVQAERGRQEMVAYVDTLFKSGRFRRFPEEGRLLMVEALCDVGLFRHALHILREAAPADVGERKRLYGLVMAAAAAGADHDLVFQLHDEMMAHMGPGPAANRDVYHAVLLSLRAVGVDTGPGLAAKATAEERSPEARWQRLAMEMLGACTGEVGREGVAGRTRPSSASNMSGKESGPIVRGGNEVLAACVAAREWELGTRALVELGKRRLAFDEQTYQQAIAILAERREGPRAVQLLREMQGRGFQARTAEYNHAMFACLDRHWATALELFHEVESGAVPGVRMDTGTTMAALGACRSGKKWQLASAILESARAQEVELSLVLFNAVLGVYAAAQQTGKVLETLEEMRFLGVRPDEFTYNTAIGAFAKVGDYRQAGQWLSIMTWEGVSASTVTYNCALNACANGGNPQRAAELFQEMRDRKVGVDHVTYGTLVHAFAKAGQWEGALRYLDEMRQSTSGIKPNNFVYCSAMSACNRGNESEMALKLLDQMREVDGLVPDQYSVNEALNACAKGGLCARALKILEVARAEGVVLDVISFNKALQACITTRRWPEAQDLMRQMAAERVAPDRTTHSLVEEVFLHGPPSNPAVDMESGQDGASSEERAIGTDIGVATGLDKAGDRFDDSYKPDKEGVTSRAGALLGEPSPADTPSTLGTSSNKGSMNSNTSLTSPAPMSK
ncbi:Pentatricopeptide repeat containing protein [Nannochloropsis gaditana]|uniref:Pentatricopeptide repeat containing protein n=1 Tax=Nannochloropsis gaditana TaxID=72520 RepID=W7T7A1_9STRA|nr:Pentatricopeptide repeat containing protein [Nannochloropsis gaditana]